MNDIEGDREEEEWMNEWREVKQVPRNKKRNITRNKQFLTEIYTYTYVIKEKKIM